VKRDDVRSGFEEKAAGEYPTAWLINNED